MTDLQPIAGTAAGLPAGLNAIGVRFANSRKISMKTLARLNVESATEFFPQLNKNSEALRFWYAEGWKARAVPDKAFVAGKGFKLSFWNLEAVLRASPDTVFITEGELDACALVEAGIPQEQVLSVPNGAVERASEVEKEIRGYAYVLDALKAGLAKVRKFVWCGDMDGPGRSLRSDMAKILGVARFWFVEWPEGCKDANDFLIHDGGQAVRELVIDGALQWPIDGLFKLSELPEPAAMTLWNPGFPEWESKIRLAPRTLSVVTGHPGHGKALALDTPIPTPYGWKTMGTLRLGDTIFDESGQSCEVTFATPVMVDHECFTVRFDDGSEIVADADHLWLTETEAARQSERAWKRRGGRDDVLPRGTNQSEKRVLPAVVMTAQIAQTLVVNGKNNHAVRLPDPVQCDEQDLPVPPYTLGVWLGDGNSDCAYVTCDDRDSEIMEHVAAEGVPVVRKDRFQRTAAWSLSDGIKSPVKDSISGRLKRLGLYGNKHVPMMYKRAAIGQRLALLQGLMDTDGHVSNGAAEFSTTREVLADDVYELICSLGIRAKIDRGVSRLNGRDCGPKFRIRFSSTLPVFKLSRKAAKNSEFIGRRKYRYIVSCEKVASVPVRCIQVNSPSHLFLAGRSFIPTHNTQLWTQVWFNIVRAYCVPIAVASFETRAKPHLQRYLRTLLSGKLEKNMDEEEKHKADAFIEDRYLFMVHPDGRPSLKWFLDMAEVAVVRHGARIIQVDPWNRLEASRGRDQSETEYIGMCLREIHSFAHDMNCHVQILAHPAKMEGNRRGQAPGLEDISGSKNWENMCDQGFVVHRPKMFDGKERLTKAELHHRKARFDELGYPCVLDLDFRPAIGKYVSADYDQ